MRTHNDLEQNIRRQHPESSVAHAIARSYIEDNDPVYVSGSPTHDEHLCWMTPVMAERPGSAEQIKVPLLSSNTVALGRPSVAHPGVRKLVRYLALLAVALLWLQLLGMIATHLATSCFGVSTCLQEYQYLPQPLNLREATQLSVREPQVWIEYAESMTQPMISQRALSAIRERHRHARQHNMTEVETPLPLANHQIEMLTKNGEIAFPRWCLSREIPVVGGLLSICILTLELAYWCYVFYPSSVHDFSIDEDEEFESSEWASHPMSTLFTELLGSLDLWALLLGFVQVLKDSLAPPGTSTSLPLSITA